MKCLLTLAFPLLAIGQTVSAVPPPTFPSYFSTTGGRYSYYDKTLTETTNFGVHVTGAQTSDTPQGLWAIASVDATPRTAASSAALRLGSRYFLRPVAGSKVIAYANIAAGATTATTAAVSAASSGAVSSSLLGNLQGGMGIIWRVCKTFNSNTKVNCIADFDYELNAVSSQAVKPIIGLYIGVSF